MQLLKIFTAPPTLLSQSIIIFLLAAAISQPLAAGEREENADRLETLREQINSVQQEQTRNKHLQNELNHQLEQLQSTINELGAVIAALQQNSRTQQQQINKLEHHLTKQQLRLGKHKKLLGHLARRAYLNGRQEHLKLLLNQQDPADIQRMLSYYGYLQQAHMAEITELRALIIDLEATQTELVTAKQAAATTTDKISQQQRTLDTQRSDQKKVLTRLVTEYQDNESRLREMRKNEARLASLLEKLQHAITDIPDSIGEAFSAARGTLPWPVKGQLRHRFGQQKHNTALRWQGVLIDTPSASEVRAIHPGRVAFADWLRGFGLLIIIDHGDDYLTIYGHNQALLRDSGSWVTRGETIATAGEGGGETEPGLYFEIRHRGKPTDPAKWCDGPR